MSNRKIKKDLRFCTLVSMLFLQAFNVCLSILKGVHFQFDNCCNLFKIGSFEWKNFKNYWIVSQPTPIEPIMRWQNRLLPVLCAASPPGYSGTIPRSWNTVFRDYVRSARTIILEVIDTIRHSRCLYPAFSNRSFSGKPYQIWSVTG